MPDEELYWLPTVVFLLHVVEELPRFPAWATRHFAATSRAWYVYSHLVLLAMAATMSAQAEAAELRTAWPMLAVAFQWVLGANALFHITTTVLFREYSPGVLTGTFFSVPATAYLSHHAIAAEHVTTAQLGSAVALGIMACVLGVASLWLRMDIGWNLRRSGSDVGAPRRRVVPPNEEL